MYRPKVVKQLGHLRIPVVWEKVPFKCGDGGECYGIFTDDGIRVVDNVNAIGILVHEMWHAQSAEVADDDPTRTDDEARRVTTFITDLVTNNWRILEALKEEKGRS